MMWLIWAVVIYMFFFSGPSSTMMDSPIFASDLPVAEAAVLDAPAKAQYDKWIERCEAYLDRLWSNGKDPLNNDMQSETEVAIAFAAKVNCERAHLVLLEQHKGAE